MKDLVIRAFQQHPMFEGISLANCATLMNCLGCIEKKYKKDQLISPSEVYARQIGIVIDGCVHTVQEDVWGRCTFLSYTNEDGIFGDVLIGETATERGIIFKATEPTTILFLPADRILHPCRNSCPFHHQLSRNLFNMISHKNAVLTEKIEIAENRVEADPNAMLFEVDAISRFDRMNLPFILDWGIAAGIKSPKSSTEQDRDKLMNRLFLFQDTLQAESGGKAALQYIDLESWTRRYLIDEIFENFDGGCHSQFFYWDPREGKDNRIYAGPCWDFDNCADSWSEAKQNPRCFPMLRIWKNDSEHTPWYGTLMEQSAFRNRVTELYRTELSAKLHRLLQVDIEEETALIQTALNLNALRWNLADPTEAIRHFHDFMEERIAFLDSAWIDGIEYRTVTAKSIGDYRFYCTTPGEVCEDIPTPEELGMERGTIWIREDNGETFDRKMPIWEDLTIIAVPGDGQVKSSDN